MEIENGKQKRQEKRIKRDDSKKIKVKEGKQKQKTRETKIKGEEKTERTEGKAYREEKRNQEERDKKKSLIGENNKDKTWKRKCRSRNEKRIGTVNNGDTGRWKE